MNAGVIGQQQSRKLRQAGASARLASTGAGTLAGWHRHSVDCVVIQKAPTIIITECMHRFHLKHVPEGVRRENRQKEIGRIHIQQSVHVVRIVLRNIHL